MVPMLFLAVFAETKNLNKLEENKILLYEHKHVIMGGEIWVAQMKITNF